MQNTQLYLASGSPRRLQLLQQLGLQIEVFAAEIDETPSPMETPQHYVQRMAREKNQAARTLWQKQRGNAPHLPVLSADTIVVSNGQILGKPRDAAHAKAMLRQLSASTHQVLTALCLSYENQLLSDLNISQVRFRALTEAEIDGYIRSSEPLDKAGAYGIQGLGGIFIEHIEGSFTGVMGLPIFECAQLLRRAGVNLL
ncbi:Maf family protein [Caviibacterium pharyngocola]|uniref:dTTP/UTP pyrophosphatase n=1 Tax=Caviibacterium pharyngocola TaxID=28159 RepID=A0A2M8RU99_9PAST|nr:nucleoside triphosphate pyrophosphatase [Caviibacterium pharyngocola]PJG82466.1 septum formation inhibitor Maf [Caviibacterium pharyngocola]